MRAFFFGSRPRTLFGAYDAAVGGRRKGVVLCAPWGPEALRAHPALRQLARRCAERGRHALRFDYYGTGDAAGATEAGVDPGGWSEDLESAIEELRDSADLTRVALVGLRLGAVPALRAAASRRDVERLVLWEPVLDGPRYLAELESRAEGGVVEGFPIEPGTRTFLEALDPAEVGKGAPKMLVVSGTGAPEHTGLRRRLGAVDADFEWVVPQGPPCWLEEEDYGTAGMPVAAIRAITEWLG